MMHVKGGRPGLESQTRGHAPAPVSTAPVILRRGLTTKMVQTGSLKFNCSGSPAAERMLRTMLNVCGADLTATTPRSVQVRKGGCLPHACSRRA